MFARDTLSAPKTIRGLIDAVARCKPQATALVGLDGSSLTYAALLDRIDRAGAALRAQRVGPDDRVAVIMPEGLEAAATLLAIASNAIACPFNPAYKAAEFASLLASFDVRTLVLDPSRIPVSGFVQHDRRLRLIDVATLSGLEQFDGFDASRDSIERERGEVAILLHTSGTTSRPKLVPLDHEQLYAAATNVAASLDLRADDRCLNVMPLFHVHGIVGALLSSLAAGASIVCSEGFVSRTFVRSLRISASTWYTAVPTMHQAIVTCAGADEPMPRLRFVRSSSAALAPSTARDLERIFAAPVIEAYGMTEAAHQMCSNPLPPGERRFGTVGLPTGIAVTVLDERGEERPCGEIGEIAVRGRSIMRGYVDDADANTVAFVRGWFRTGDLGRADSDGYLTLVGRVKEIINRGGESISPREIDEALLEHPAVMQAVSFALPDERLGEEIGAVVVLAPGLPVAEAELQRFVGERLADFKIPRRIVFRETLPLGPTGKVVRLELAALLELERPLSATASQRNAVWAPDSCYEIPLRAIWCEVLGIDTIERDVDFFVVGGDSLQASRVLARIRRDLRRELAITAFFASPTIATMALAIEGALETDATAERSA